MAEQRDPEKRPLIMSSERTPLIQSVPVAEPRARYPHARVRRICTIVITSAILVAAGVFLGIALTGNTDVLKGKPRGGTEDFASIAELPHTAWPESHGISYKELKKTLLATPDAKKAREWSQYYTAGPHLAGKNESQAQWTKDLWKQFGVDHAEVVSYDVYINYPLDHRLALLKDGEVAFEATLEEDVVDEDPTTNLTDRVPVFHGYSADGDVTGQFVYANYGTWWDYEALVKAGIDLKGKIVIAKYGANFRGLKVARASELGAVGVVMYSDPGDDGEITEENGYKTYPDGPARNPSSVQRGSVEYLSFAPGDPTTIGYPSKPGVPRQSVEGKIPDIPSLPISYKEALPILKALNGHGPNASSFSKYWQGGGLGYKGVEYNIGPSPESLTINLVNKQEYVTTPLWNAIGVINGTASDEVIVIGNHRDAWIAGGAGDPNSGSAALNEVVRSFGKALDAGWKPHRTIVFASWDGEEYGLIGSTEWVEEYLPWLSASTIAYINVDVGARGPHFTTSAAPVLNKAIYEVTGQVLSPNQTVKGTTVRDTWNGHISTMGSGSDFTAFQDFAGISSIDLGFGAGPNDPVYHYHSNYDSFYWMDTYGDPGFEYHITIAKIISLLAAKLVEEPIVQFNATDYAIGVEKYLNDVKALAKEQDWDLSATAAPFKQLDEAAAHFKEASIEFDAAVTRLEEHLADVRIAERRKKALYQAIKTTNKKYKFLERQFLHADGLDKRDWFKHVVFAPGRWTGYAGATFPGLVESLEDHDAENLKKWAGIITGRIYAAAHLLLEK
ncbi:Putative PA domain, transferrin receptor-like, dimerization domain, peptidase M28 [Septoria linicola]|uniref:PA domain, transferrin receptor-like, dimerization domain, peptidase M28 n=1 Tax=Septoria linicola TaxID=215465 RepID=A0A9Q9EGN3_9PEZI|nr:Putative PA domain, transferrin receptor-like, dimerization domain, peptidase M28 [Septoria linicola]